MGTKGRDIALWFVIFGFPLFLLAFVKGYRLTELLLCISLVISCLGILWFQFYTLPHMAVRSREIGLKIVILLPLSPLLARMIVRNNIQGKIHKAYEIHLPPDQKWSMAQYFTLLDDDLVFLARSAKMVGTMVMWETPTPVPFRFRQLIHEKKTEKTAILAKNGWGIPSPPLVNVTLKNTKHHIYRGAYLITETLGKG